MARKRLLLGTGNKDKARELSRLLSGLEFEILTLNDFPPVDEPKETETSFEANALLKARYYANAFELPALADDSGLEVDALDGDPGVYSARYAGENCTYADNNEKLLAALSGQSESERTARFVCCAAYCEPNGKDRLETGVVEGTIGFEPRGGNGFGYDPLFIPDGMQKTFAEMTHEEKAALSHRARAFGQMRLFLESL